MIRITMAVVVLSVTAQSGATTAQESARVLRAAMTTETVDGNLESAIEQYRKVVAGADRQLAALALLRIAGCYERLGDPAARSTYLQVIARYPEQLETVATARSRLGQATGSSASTQPSLRRVWAGDRSSTLLADGRRISWNDDQNLVVYSPDGSSPRVLTEQSSRGAADHSAGWRASPDGRRLAYSWYTKKGRYDLRVIALDGTGVPTPRVLHDHPDLNVINPRDWSPDGRFIAVAIERRDRTSALGLIDSSDGRVRLLETSAWNGSDAYFSPDGRTIAFDAPAAGRQQDVRLIWLDTGRETVIAEHDANDSVSGWTPEGHLLFTSDRRGSTDLWLQPLAQGQPSGEPRMLYGNLGYKRSTGLMNRDGALYLDDTDTETDVLVASVEPTSGKTVSAATRAGGRFVGINEYPDWSRDGKFLAFLSSRPEGRTLVIQDAESGQTMRELRVSLRGTANLRWSPDGRAFLLSGTDARGRIGVFQIDIESGKIAPVATPRDDFWRGFRPEWFPDGKRVYYSVPAADRSGGVVVIEHDLTTSKEREVLRRTSRAEQIHRDINISPDGRFIASSSDDGRALVLYPLQGTAPREIYRAPDGRLVQPTMAWTADSQGLVVRTGAGPEQARELWVVRLDGRAPVKLELAAPVSDFRLHPDGRRIAFTARQRRSEVWLLQNFLPTER